MPAVTTSVDASTGQLLVEWTAPSTNGASISAYVIEVQASDSTWHTTTSCDGTSLSVVGLRRCLIPMQTLTSAPFTLALDALVQVRVAAVNSKGTGLTSTLLTTGGRVRTVPTAANIPERGTDTTQFRI